MLIDSALLEHVEEQRALNASLAEINAQLEEADPETPEGLAKRRAMMEPEGASGREPLSGAEGLG